MLSFAVTLNAHSTRKAGSTAKRIPLSPPEKSKSKDLLFSIRSEGSECNLTAGEYVIAAGVWHHALACIVLRIDNIHHIGLIDEVGMFRIVIGKKNKNRRIFLLIIAIVK